MTNHSGRKKPWRWLYVLEHGGRLCRGGLASAIVSYWMARRIPMAKKVFLVDDRSRMSSEIERLAVALAAFHAKHGRWPTKLSALCPSLVKAVPMDRFSGKPLIYKPRQDGYLLYSVGQNLRDDGGLFGTSVPDGPPADRTDDIVAQVGTPQPAPAATQTGQAETQPLADSD